MLYIKDQSLFRNYYKTEISKSRDEDIDTSFINTFHPDANKNYIKGFSFLTYGTQRKVGGFLQAAALNVAADQQAIYELIQNADDCESDLFSIFYTKEYLLCINNGLPFSKSNMSAIINIGDSDKDAEDIGTFGIGFKIIHRLLGEDDGLKAIISDYAGPIVFSWDQYNHLVKLLNDEEIRVNNFEEKEDSCPWLLKIVYTCFPTHMEERVKNEKYSQAVLFKKQELSEFRTFLKSSISNLNTFSDNNLKRGSIFFLKIGSDKYKYINDNIENIINGIGYSFNFLKKLKRIYINDKEINKVEVKLKSFEYKIGSDAFKQIRPRNAERNITFSFAYFTNYKDSIKLKETPNIFNFFSMEEEKNGWCFLLHCNSFDMHNDRRKLQPNSNINERLLPFIAKEIKDFLEHLSSKNKVLFYNIYPSLLLSDIPNDKPHLNDFFYQNLIPILSEKIPTLYGFSDNPEEVAIKKTKLPISPSDWGVEKQWFYWTDFKEDELVIKEAQNKDKLGLEKMSVSSLIENGEIAKINAWLSNASKSDFDLFIDELEKDIPKDNFYDLRFLKCSDDNFYSINEIVTNSRVLCIFEKISEIKDILVDLDLIVTEINISAYKKISEEASKKLLYLKTINEKKVFDEFIKTSTLENNLSPKNKKRLFLAIKDLHNVGEKSLKEWELFSASDGAICPLSNLINSKITVEPWLEKYQLIKSEFFSELIEYLIPLDSIFPSIIFPYWEDIINENNFSKSSIDDFYSAVIKYFDEEKHKSYVLNKKSYIFTDDGFFPTSDVYFNDSFSSTTSYDLLKSSIQKTTGFKTPSKKVLKFLTESPFKTENDKLLDHISDCTLDKSEAFELLKHCLKADINIFSKGVFIESGNNIEWKCSNSKFQFFSEDIELIDFISENLHDTFMLLPGHLFDFKTFEGVKRNRELYEEIIKQHDSIYDIPNEFLPLLKNKDVIKPYISKLPEIRLEYKNSYTKIDFEYLIISNIAANFDDNEMEDIRKKIIIYNDGIEFKLNQIVTGNEVQFDVNDKIYNIKVSGILPTSDNSSHSDMLESVINNLKNLEIPKSKIDEMLAVDIADDDLPEKLADELLATLDESKTLTTSEQLAFCLLYEIQYGWNNFKDFNVISYNEEKYSTNYTWYVKNYSFLSKNAAISEIYTGLSKILKIKDDNPILKINDECIFLFKPVFDENGHFLCEYINENLSEPQCIDFFDFLFSEYNKRGKDSKRDFESINDWSKFHDTESVQIFGFNPHNIIITDKSDFIISSEESPDWLKEWVNDDQKMKFLQVLGIHLEDSDILALRRSLYLKKTSITPEQISDSSSLNELLLENSLKWMIDAEIWSQKIVDLPDKVEILDAVLKKLEWDEDQYWLININKLNEHSSEWNDDAYNLWREEDDSFEIFLYDGQMPYSLEYSGCTLAEKNKDDYWYDDDNAVFYANKNKSIESLLHNAADDGLIERDSIRLLISQGLTKVNELEKQVQKLRKENDALKAKPDKAPKRTDATSKEDQAEANKEARIAVKSYLIRSPNDGYNVSKWDPLSGNSMVVNKILKNGVPINIVVKSAKWGDIFLAANEFELLCQNIKNQLFVYNGFDVKPVTLSSIFESNSLIQLQLDTEYIPPEVLSHLAKAFKYLSNTKFVVEDPNHSANAILTRIGTNNLNEGFISSADDDEF